MKQKILSLCLLFIVYNCISQPYVSLAPSFTNTAGPLADKLNLALEVGQQWDVFSLGLDIGKTTFSQVSGKDTSLYLEIRPSLNVFQQGKFTNTLTIGAGYVFGAEESLLTELTYGIEYAFTPKTHFNVFFGQYYYSGRYTASNPTFFGISAMFYFKSYNSGSLIQQKTK